MRKAKTVEEPKRKLRPALTPEARENQLIALATDLVEQRLIDGTASSQETTHFLKLGSSKHRLEMKKLEAESDLAVAKKEAMESQKHIEELYAEAISSFKRYAGLGNEEEVYDDGES